MVNDEHIPLEPVLPPLEGGESIPELELVGQTNNSSEPAEYTEDDDFEGEEDDPNDDSPLVMEPDMSPDQQRRFGDTIRRHPSRPIPEQEAEPEPEQEPELDERTIREDLGYNGIPKKDETSSNVVSISSRRPVGNARRPIAEVLRPPAERADPAVVQRITEATRADLAAKDSPTETLATQYRATKAARDLVDSPVTPAPTSLRGRPFLPHPSQRDNNEETEE